LLLLLHCSLEFFRIVLCNSFPAMLLNRFIVSCLFFLLTISAIDVNSYSSIKQYRDALIARLLLKSWRKKVEEQRVRFFDRLPQSVESRYTTVNSTNAMAWYYLNIILSSFMFGFCLNRRKLSHTEDILPRFTTWLQTTGKEF
jgi:hypothetical protein